MARSKAQKSLDKVCSLTLDMEEPLRDTERLVTALRFMGHGMARLDSDGGEAVAHLAWAASKELETLKELWDKTCDAARR
jgi:hypothetical protein